LGFRGNYLLVMPKEKLVAVRVVRNDADYNWNTDGLTIFCNRRREWRGKR
jgi:hypothetical protein